MNTTTKTILSILVIIAAVLALIFILKIPAQAPTVQAPIVNPEITLTNLTNGDSVQLPFTVNGEVKGNWFFEASFPVFIKDQNGNQLGYGLASSPQDWMTANMIPFSVTLPTVNYTGPGTIVFQKDNPSGEPQFDASLIVPVTIQ